CGAKKVENIESDKTQLYIGVAATGIGDEWLKDAIDRFEKAYADVSFEEGKTGVQVIIAENNKTTMLGPDLINVIDKTETEVFFTEAVFYYEWVNKNKMYDITEAATEKLTEFGEDKSIVDKMDEDLRNSLTVDGKIYALPFWMGSYGITYNATLFDENSWYYAEDGKFTNASGKLSAGPDGKTGTYDDGMPSTYDEFYVLLDEINRDNVTPLQWAGASPDYFSWFLGSLFADYEGYEDLMLNYNFDGTTEVVKPGSINVETGAYETEEIKIGDTYTLLTEFYENSIKTGIKKGDLSSPSNFATRTITGGCSQPTTGANYVRGSKTENYTAVVANLCATFRGTVGFAYLGAETAIRHFKVTHMVNTSHIPTVTLFNKQKILQLVEKREQLCGPVISKTSEIPTRSLQKELNLRKHFIDPELIPQNRLSKFCILSNMHILHKNYFSDFENSATFKKNFLKHINRSDSEFLLSCGDTLSDAYDYNYFYCIETNKNLTAFYDLMTHLPDKDYFVLKGNRDDSTSDFADNFVIYEKNVTVIGFRAEYLQYNVSNEDAFRSTGRV
ncbi:MAG: hypothetical protein IKT44_00630, partial [Clostridia bacterium]|nr:hypothetical protein [Clostridia bacterium]